MKPRCGFPLAKNIHLCQLLGWSQAAANLISLDCCYLASCRHYTALLQCLYISFFSPSLGGSVVIRGKFHTILLRCRLRTCWGKRQTNLMRSGEPTGPPNNYYIESQLGLFFPLPERKRHTERRHRWVRPVEARGSSEETRETATWWRTLGEMSRDESSKWSISSLLFLPPRSDISVTSSTTLNKTHQPQTFVHTHNGIITFIYSIIIIIIHFFQNFLKQLETASSKPEFLHCLFSLMCSHFRLLFCLLKYSLSCT